MATKKAENTKMALWEQVCTTDKDHTRTAQLDGRPVTSINTQYLIQRATETFGPVGKGWGYEVLIDRFDQGAAVTTKDQVVIGHEQMHTCQVKLWYLHGGKRNSVVHYGHTPYVRRSQYGLYTDFDAPKKSLSDAIKKCLSMIGFAADVHLGLFDDQTYLQGLELKKRLEEAGDESSVMDEAKEEFKDWLSRQISALERAPSLQSLELMRKQFVITARAKALVVRFNPDEIEQRINNACEAYAATLSTPKE